MNVPLTPLRFLERAMDLFPDRIGVVSGSREFTYAQFVERCRRLADGLAGRGLDPGDRVAFLSFNTHKLLEGYYGVVQAHGVVMPINIRLSPQEIIAILNHSGAKMVCLEKDFAPLTPHIRQHCGGVRNVVALDEGIPDCDLTYEEIVAGGRDVPADVMSYNENEMAELFYTSGSTGTPKGVMLTHRNLYLHAITNMCMMDPTAEVVDLHTIPLFHANGWGRPQISVMLGYKQVMVRRFDPADVLALVEKHRATDMCLVPTMAYMVLACPELGKRDTSSLQRIMLGGAASSPELIKKLEDAFGCLVTAGYGLTETGPVVSVGRPLTRREPEAEAARLRSRARAGWPVVGCRVRVVNLEGADVPRDNQTIGEAVVQGDNVMAGYYQDEAGTAAVIRDGWLHTGDMAVWDETGAIHIVDRKKEIIISGGENISSIEVERAIMMHDAVAECAVVAAPDERWGEVPAALVVRKPGAALDAETLSAFLEDRLGKFKLPRLIEFHDEPLPKTGTGKVRKTQLRERFWADREKRVNG